MNKELSIEEKAKRYDEALPQLKGLLDGIHEEKCDIIEEDIIKIFPELAESDDERIRKALINGFNKLDKNAVWYNGITNGQIIAWLEKQGNNMGISEATKKKLENALNKALEKETPESFNEFLDEQCEQKPDDEVGNYDHKKVLQTIINEKNSSWSEEDEETLNTIINHFKIDIECTDEDDIIKWLKSIKERYTWKPSDEQMVALYTYIYHPQYIDNSDDCRIKLVISLYEQLKQL